MDQTPFKDKKLEFVVFDACLMGNIETAALWQNYADYMIASEDLEKGNGWDYSFLSQFSTSKDRDSRFAYLLQEYKRSNDANYSEYDTPYALAVYDLSAVSNIMPL